MSRKPRRVYQDAIINYVPCVDSNPCGYLDTVLSQNIAQGTPPVNLLTVTGGSVASNVTLPRLISYVKPDLQAQDGTFFGIVDYDWSGDDFLASFDKSGNVKWSNLGYYAQIATSDGGVIGQSYSGQSYTFDANGNSTGQLASLPTQSWTGSAYQQPNVTQVAFVPIDLTTSYAAVSGGNPSVVANLFGSLTYVQSYSAPQEGLYALVTANLKATPECNDLLGRLASVKHITENILISQLQSTANGSPGLHLTCSPISAHG